MPDLALTPLIGMALLLLAPALRVARALVPLPSVPRLISPELRISRQMWRGYYHFLLVVFGLGGVAMVLFFVWWLVLFAAAVWLGVEFWIRRRPRARRLRLTRSVNVFVRPATPLAPWHRWASTDRDGWMLELPPDYEVTIDVRRAASTDIWDLLGRLGKAVDGLWLAEVIGGGPRTWKFIAKRFRRVRYVDASGSDLDDAGA